MPCIQTVKLTRHVFKHYGLSLLIFPGGFSDGFITSGKGYDSEKGEDQGPEIGDSPAFEYDAEIVGFPGEEHVHRTHWLHSGHVVSAVVAVAHVAVVHVGVIHGHDRES